MSGRKSYQTSINYSSLPDRQHGTVLSKISGAGNDDERLNWHTVCIVPLEQLTHIIRNTLYEHASTETLALAEQKHSMHVDSTKARVHDAERHATPPSWQKYYPLYKRDLLIMPQATLGCHALHVMLLVTANQTMCMLQTNVVTS